MSPYVEAVIARINRLGGVPNPNDIPSVISGIEQLETRGFSETDAVIYTRCTEEVNPDLSEESALRKMKAISSKYPNPKFGQSRES